MPELCCALSVLLCLQVRMYIRQQSKHRNLQTNKVLKELPVPWHSSVLLLWQKHSIFSVLGIFYNLRTYWTWLWSQPLEHILHAVFLCLPCYCGYMLMPTDVWMAALIGNPKVAFDLMITLNRNFTHCWLRWHFIIHTAMLGFYGCDEFYLKDVICVQGLR